MKDNTDRFKLKSSPLCFAPGMMRYIQHLAESNPEQAHEILAAWTPDKRVFNAIRAGKYIVSDDEVIVDVRNQFPTHESIYNELYLLTQDRVRDYRTDFGHDRTCIEAFPVGTEFIHIARDMGTHLYMLPKADDPSWPRRDVKVRYLFGVADREHMLSGVESSIVYHRAHNHGALWTHFDGVEFLPITPDMALAQARRYMQEIKKAWGEL